MASTDSERVKERTDIAALIGEHVRLKRAGASMKGLCPFHQEDTPSFVVSPARQMYHCFGCGESGDCFSWLMKREGMTFPEALRVLAQRAGVPLTFEHAERREERERLRATLDTAADFYHAVLLRTATGREAREYLERRGITEESIQRWRLGYVPLSTTPLIEKAKERGVTADDLLRAGIIGEGPRGPYERFYGRVLFPLTDAHGSTVGFAGRILHEDKARPAAKYVNSPETVLYTKSRVLYGLDKAREAIRRENLVVIVEGYTDVIASHQAGVENVVAASGTALTDDHLHTVKRFTDRLAFAFDADTAGDHATRRAIDLAVAAGCAVEVVLLPAEKDPADIAVANPTEWKNAIADRRDVFSVLLDRAVARYGVSDTDAKKAVAHDLLPLLTRVPDAISLGDYLQRLAAVIRVDSRYLHEDLEHLRKREEAASSPQRASPSQSPGMDPVIRREERLLTLFMAAPAIFPLAAAHVPPAAFTGAHTRLLYDAFLQWYAREHAAGAPLDFSHIDAVLPEDLRHHVNIFRLCIDMERAEGLLETPDRDARVVLRDLLVGHVRRTLVELTHQLEVAPLARRPALLRDVVNVTEELAHVDQLKLS